MADIIGIGTGKAGSTWVHKILVQSPQIQSNTPKEINYLDVKKHKLDDLDWYNKVLKKDLGLKTVDISVQYIYSSHAIYNVKRFFQSSQIIITLRDPIERIDSNYYHDIRKGVISSAMSLSEYFCKFDYEVVDYEKFVSNWLNEIGRERVHVIVYDDIKDKPEIVVEKLFSVCDLEPLSAIDISASNTGFVPKVVFIENLITALSQFLTRKKKVVFLEWLKRLHLHTFIRSINKSPIKKRARMSDVPEEMHAFIERQRHFIEQFRI